MEARRLSSEQLRDTLGTEAAWVHEHEAAVIITEGGRAQGGLIAARTAETAGLAVTADHGIRQARAQWGATRTTAETEGPQGLTYHRRRIAVLVDQPTLTAVQRGLPVLTFGELEVTADGLTLVNGEPALPGDYTLPGGRTLRINAPRRKESAMTPANEPDLPDVILQEAMAERANHLVGLYMHAARTATTSEEKEQARTNMHRVWKIQGDRTMTRDQMQHTMAALEEEIDRLGE